MNRTFALVAALVSIGVMLVASQHPRYQRMNSGEAQLRALIAGSGAAVVVFENGLGAPLSYWHRVQREVSGFATTMSFGPRQIATELHTALRNAGLAPPYVLTGHSLGGLYVRIYAAMFPDEVAALVLVDPMRSDEFDVANFKASGHPEYDAIPATMAQAAAATIPGNVPVYLISAMGARGEPYVGDSENRQASAAARSEDLNAHKAWVESLGKGQLIVTENSGHNVPIEEDTLVVETIRRALDDVAAAGR